MLGSNMRVCREAQAELVERIQMAVALPVRTSIKDVYDDTCTELLVTSQLDSGARMGQCACSASCCTACASEMPWHCLQCRSCVQPQATAGMSRCKRRTHEVSFMMPFWWN